MSRIINANEDNARKTIPFNYLDIASEAKEKELHSNAQVGEAVQRIDEANRKIVDADAYLEKIREVATRIKENAEKMRTETLAEANAIIEKARNTAEQQAREGARKAAEQAALEVAEEATKHVSKNVAKDLLKRTNVQIQLARKQGDKIIAEAETAKANAIEIRNVAKKVLADADRMKKEAEKIRQDAQQEKKRVEGGHTEIEKLKEGVEKIKEEARQHEQTAKEKIVQAEQEAERIKQEAEKNAEIYEEEQKDALFDKAHLDAMKKINEYLNERLDVFKPAILKALSELQSEKEAWIAHWEKVAVHLATSIASKILRRSVKLEETPDIIASREEMIREALRLASGEPDIRLSLAPQDIEALGEGTEKLIDELGMLGKVEIIENEKLVSGECRIDTEFGTINNTFEAQLDRINVELVGE